MKKIGIAISHAVIFTAVLVSAQENSIGKVFRVSGDSVEITGGHISRARRGQKLTVATSAGDVAVTVSEIFHTKLVCTSEAGKAAQITVGDRVFYAKPKATPGPKTAAPELSQHSDATVQDTKGRLVWKKCSEGSRATGNGCSLPSKYSQTCGEGESPCQSEAKRGKTGTLSFAAEACAKLNEAQGVAGRSNWRLPRAAELKSLVFCGNAAGTAPAGQGCPADARKPTIQGEFFPDTPAHCYWSSTAQKNEENLIYGVHFDDGNVTALDRATYCYVRCVSGGN